MNLIDALSLNNREIIALVGGGGKTTLMFALARELSSQGHRVITTTTTKIMEPTPQETPQLLLVANEEDSLDLIFQQLEKYRHVTLASERLDSRRLRGFKPGSIEKIDLIKLAPYVIVEADGAKHRPLKAPNDSEPVIPQNTTLVIAMVGIDALGCRLNEACVFRSEIASKLLGLPLGSIMSTAAIAELVTHPQGITKGSPPQARVMPFINKIDPEKDRLRGRELAKSILNFHHPRIERVILGQAQMSEPVLEVINQVLSPVDPLP